MSTKSEKIRKNIRLLIIVVISMMFGSIITIFLKDSNILIGIPNTMKDKFRKLGERLQQKSKPNEPVR